MQFLFSKVEETGLKFEAATGASPEKGMGSGPFSASGASSSEGAKRQMERVRAEAAEKSRLQSAKLAR